MLPFLKPKPQTGVIVKEIKSSGDIKENHDEDHGLMSASEDLIRAVHAKDANAVKSALKAAYEICDAQLHEESEHLNSENDDNSYDSLNRRAALEGND